MTWDGVVRLRGETLESLALRHGGQVVAGPSRVPRSIASVERAGAGDLAPLFARRFVSAARAAANRGAAILVDASLALSFGSADAVWRHDHAEWAMALLLDEALVPDEQPTVGADCSISPTAVLGPRVVVGARVRVGAGAVIGAPGFGWARGPEGRVRAVPQLGGVVLEDDVAVGPLSTIDAGTLGPTRVRRGAKLDAHVHVGHNSEIGEETLVAAQCGFAGSVTVGARVLVGGQVGIADHVVVGDHARIAAKSGVIADVPANATMAGYPAVPRMRWWRAVAKLYGAARGDR